MNDPIDVVYTWVDDSWPGYLEEMHGYAETRHDRNPNRTRDNLDVLKYSLRSVARYVPWVRNLYLFAMRPQVPPWLDVDHPRVHVVHHDAVMDPGILPTYNSFAIVSHLGAIEGVSERFLYVCDDFLMGAPVSRGQLLGDEDGDGDPMYFESRYAPPPSVMHSDRRSPWDAGRAYTNQLMDEAFGAARRRDPAHAPLAIRRSVWAEMVERFAGDFERLRASRFRAKYNVVPEFLYPHFAIETGRAHAVPQEVSESEMHYVAITNSDWKARYDTWRLARKGPRFFTLNDDFGSSPSPRVVRRWRRALDALLPEPSPFER